MRQNEYKTDQEKFWAGEFGTEYISRNQDHQLLASNLKFLSTALDTVPALSSCIEFGANIGMNLKALRLLYPSILLSAIEINEAAVQELCLTVKDDRIFRGSILDFSSNECWDLVLIKGVLIHIAPSELCAVYEKLVSATRLYLLVAEYYNPVPVALPYRGHHDRLFKRDFAGEILDKFPMMSLRSYGFGYHRDPSFPQDDINWFLLERK